ncbi:D-cysteine desulfhydrase [Escherichia coli]|uniref:D-cysteine desulfhydrase n=1 Tax=Escherichia coli TaxID=562 RepID=A0A2X1NAF0_ECOLX|nr:D-cysteine desulfhydrase [Escherichia coli]
MTILAPGYGVPNDEGMEAVKLLARLEGILLDPVYTGKAMAGLIDGISQKRFKDEGPILFIHTGGAPALFAYHPTFSSGNAHARKYTTGY